MPGFKPNKPRHRWWCFYGQDMYGRTLTRPAATATDKWGNWGQVGVYNQIQGRGYRSPGWVEVFNSTQDLEMGKDGPLAALVFLGR